MGLTFLFPLVLIGLLALPAIWWLLRLTPPHPKQVPFPAIQFLFAIEDEEDTAAQTPLWLLILRMIIATLVILALAHPVIRPKTDDTTAAPILLVIDNGWASAHDWQNKKDLAIQLLNRYASRELPVAIIPTAPPFKYEQIRSVMTLDEAEERLGRLAVKPWEINRTEASVLAVEMRDRLATEHGSVTAIWVSDDLATPGTQMLFNALKDVANPVFASTEAGSENLLLSNDTHGDEGRSLKVSRAHAGEEISGQIDGYDQLGNNIAAIPFSLGATELEAAAEITFPNEIRNRIHRFQIRQARSAASTLLVDRSFHRKRVGLASRQGSDPERPLLTGTYYLESALQPIADLELAPLSSLLEMQIDALMTSASFSSGSAISQSVTDWVRSGGVLVRFATSDMNDEEDPLLPVPLRVGGRSLGGAMTWSQPQKVAPFEDASPFNGLDVPADILVKTQLLAEPVIDLYDHTWAQLEDGTPLVTAKQVGSGLIVLFHVSATPDWSNLPMSGLFLDMLELILQQGSSLKKNEALSSNAVLQPYLTMDGFGALSPAAPDILAPQTPGTASWKASPKTPPGFYGPATGPTAFNLSDSIETVASLTGLPETFKIHTGQSFKTLDLKVYLLILALIGLFADTIISLHHRGKLFAITARLQSIRSLVVVGLASVAVSQLLAAPSLAADQDFIELSRQTHFGYILTGKADIDRMSEAGLNGLSSILRKRTAVEPGDAMAIELDKDTLAFYPLIYWPITKDQPLLTPEQVEKLNEYMALGGLLLVDTQDHGAGGSATTTAAAARLAKVLGQLDIPPLARMPHDHVLTKSFYLIQEFPGRWSGGDVWVQAQEAGQGITQGVSNDGVSPIVIGSNDWTSAWAVDANGRPIAAVSPGGRKQREVAYRFGVNLAMYTLTGNYKSDQVHFKTLLDRLGQ